MIKEHVSVFRRLMIFLDICIVIISFFIGYLTSGYDYGPYFIKPYFEILPVLALICASLFLFFGMYRSFRIKSIFEILFIIFKTILLGFIIFSSFTYILKISYIGREVTATIFIIAGILIAIEKIVLVLIFRHARKKGYNYRSILIVGTNKRAQHFVYLINKHKEWGLKIVGFVDENEDKKGSFIDGNKVLGSFEDIPDIVHNNVVDEVVFVIPRSWLSKIEDIMYFCETEGIRMHLAIDYFELKLSKAKQTDFHGFPLLTFESTPDKLWHLLIKRLFDMVISTLGLIAGILPFCVIALIIKTTSEGPVFFRQIRCGLNGRKFTLYKFRTMHKDAEDKLEDILKHNEMKGPVFKMTNDPRITKIGKFLRKTSIDELPQLWNVFKGDMSLVGPRPPLPSEVGKYATWHRRRLSMRPGITCLWQVGGRNKITDFDEWMKLDLRYIDNWSLWLDIKIILKTIPVVLFGSGAK